MIQQALAAAKEAAHRAGEVILSYYSSYYEVQSKGVDNPVTTADLAANRVLHETLLAAFPEAGWLSEESADDAARLQHDYVWIIDPIDGTKNFVRRVPFWAILIALEEDGAVTTGVVFNPVTGELLTARKGEGAFANGERIHVSGCDRMADAMVLHSGLRILRTAGYWGGLERLVDAAGRTRGFGDYYGYSLVAAGRAEVYIEADLKPWDIAAVKIVVEEAGGRLTDFSGRSTIYDGTVLASNGWLHALALGLLTGG